MSGEAITPGTPLPWVSDPHDVGCIGDVSTPSGQVVAQAQQVMGDSLHQALRRQNTVYILHACNEYPALKAKADALAEALKSCPIIGRTEDPGDFQSRQDRWLDTTYRQALAAYRESGL